jgi:magnesium transporter
MNDESRDGEGEGQDSSSEEPNQLDNLRLRRIMTTAPDRVPTLLESTHPEDLADALGELHPDDAARVLSNLPASNAAPIFERLGDFTQEEIAERMAPESLASIASQMEADDAADLLEALPVEKERQVRTTLAQVDPAAAADIAKIEEWDPGTAGHLMNTAFVSVSWRDTARDAKRQIQAHRDASDDVPHEVYVLKRTGRLEGVVRVRDLLLADDDTQVVNLLQRRHVSVRPDAPHEEVIRKVARYDLVALPVLDRNSHLLGVITVDDVIDLLRKEAPVQTERLGAVEPLDVPYFKTTFVSFLKKRGVWLVVLFLEEFFTQTALRYYDPVFEAIKGASYYVPLLISTGGNSGSQSSTLIIRGLAIGEIRMRDWWRILFRETLMGVVLGVFLGAIGFARVLMYKDQGVPFACTIGLTLVGIVVTGCTVGSMLPLVLRRFGVDPATSSTPFIASLVDVLGIIVFVHCAKLVMAEVIRTAGAM